MSQSVQRLEHTPSAQFQSHSNFGPVKLAGTAGDMTVSYTYERGPDGHVVAADLLYKIEVTNGHFKGGEISGAFVKSAAPNQLPEAEPSLLVVSENYAAKKTGIMPIRLGDGRSLAHLNLEVFLNTAQKVLPETRHVVVEVRPDKKDPSQCSVSGYLVERSVLQASVYDIKEMSQASRAHRHRRYA